MLLTSYGGDAQYINNNLAAYKAFDVNLGDKFSVSYRGQKVTDTVPIQKVVNLHIDILNVEKGVAPVAMKQEVQDDVDAANDIFAQVGILFKATIQTVNPPTKDGFYLGNGLEVSVAPLLSTLTTEEQVLFDTYGHKNAADDTYISVFYVNYFAVLGARFTGLGGESFSGMNAKNGGLESKYADTIAIAADEAGNTILAHEIGHILLNSGRDDHLDNRVGVNQVNLMAPFLRANGKNHGLPP